MYFSTSGPVPQNLTVSPQINKISAISCIMSFFVSSVASFSSCHATLSIIFTFVSIVITGCFLAVPATSLLFYACFWTSWDWNKNIVLLYSMQYCIVKYTKAQPVVEDACMWQCTPNTWTNMSGHVNTHLHLWKLATWRFLCRGFTIVWFDSSACSCPVFPATCIEEAIFPFSIFFPPYSQVNWP